MDAEDIERLRPFVSEHRARQMEEIIDSRLQGITVLIESPYDHGNIAAIMRTCEALGVQSVHLVDLPPTFKPAKKIGQGADKWLTIRIHESVEQAVDWLRSRGYRILAGDLTAGTTLDQVDFSRRTAYVFGAEKEGISSRLKTMCDETYRIEMVGYSQSLNVSCAAAVTLFEATRGYRRSRGLKGDLNDEEKAEIRRLFYRRAVRFSDLLLTGSVSLDR